MEFRLEDSIGQPNLSSVGRRHTNTTSAFCRSGTATPTIHDRPLKLLRFILIFLHSLKCACFSWAPLLVAHQSSATSSFLCGSRYKYLFQIDHLSQRLYWKNSSHCFSFQFIFDFSHGFTVTTCHFYIAPFWRFGKNDKCSELGTSGRQCRPSRIHG